MAVEVAALVAHPAGNGHAEQTPLSIHSKRLDPLWDLVGEKKTKTCC
jgi:hypothetical protein